MHDQLKSLCVLEHTMYVENCTVSYVELELGKVGSQKAVCYV